MNGLTGQESLSVCLTATEEDNGKLDVMSVVMAITMEGKDQKISGMVVWHSALVMIGWLCIVISAGLLRQTLSLILIDDNVPKQ